MKSLRSNYKILNFIFFQLGWFACVLGAAEGMAMLGVYFALAFLLIHLVWQRYLARELLFVALVGGAGFAIDSLWVNLAYFSYAPMFGSELAPAWMAALWAMFALTIGSSLSWLRDKPFVASLMGGVFGPLAYYSASKLGAVSILDSGQGMILLSATWAAALPAMFVAYDAIANFGVRRKGGVYER